MNEQIADKLIAQPNKLASRFDFSDMNRQYPNNGFLSYWKYLRKQSDITGNTGYRKALKGFQTATKLTAQVLKDAGIELFFLVIFFLIITKMSQGRDLIVSLFEPDSLYGIGRIALTLLSVISFSVSMWIIPAFLFQQRDNRNKGLRVYRSIFKRHLFFAHRILPLVPFWLLAYVLFSSSIVGWVIAAVSLLQLTGLFFFNHSVKSAPTNVRWMIILAAVVLGLLAFVIFWLVLFHRTYTPAKWGLAVVLYFLSTAMFFIYHEVDRQILEEHASGKEGTPLNKYNVNSVFYIVALVIHTGIVIWLFNASPSFEFAPESMLLYIFSLYVFVIDLIVYLVNVSGTRKAWVMLGMIAIVILYKTDVFKLNVSHYTVDSVAASSVLNDRERLAFADRFALLKNDLLAYHDTVPYPIVLVSGAGGGSRAGLWFSQNLINFDSATSGHFRHHIFSLSTVSGSSVGLGTVFAYWDEKDKAGAADKPWQELPAKVYANNFIGGSVSGFLLTDVWKTFLPWKTEVDRNSVLQREEAYHTQFACNEISQGAAESKIPNDKQVLRRDFMSFFYDTTGGKLTFRNDRPLAFINTCRSNDGRRGIISPMKIGNDTFHDAVDVAGYVYDDFHCDKNGENPCRGHKRNLTLGQACNMSELFPAFSAPLYIDSLGSFVDGGYHENTGLKTTLDVYQKLRDTLQRDRELNSKAPYKIYIVYLKNGSSEKDLYKHLPSETPLTQPLSALSNQPFQGSASYFEERTKFVNMTDPLVQYIEVPLNHRLFRADEDSRNGDKMQQQILQDLTASIDTTRKDTTLNFPLARWLSKSAIKRMKLSAWTELAKNDSLRSLLETVRQMSSNPIASASANRRSEPVLSLPTGERPSSLLAERNQKVEAVTTALPNTRKRRR